MAGKEAFGFEVVRCNGTSVEQIAPLRENPVDASITVYTNGKRDVGCDFLGEKGFCRAGEIYKSALKECVHLFPQTTRVEFESDGDTSFTDQRQYGRAVLVDGKKVGLTPHEYFLVSYLKANAERVISNQELMHKLWRNDYDPTSKKARTNLTQRLKTLRRKIESDPEKPTILRNVYAQGYVLHDPENRIQLVNPSDSNDIAS